MERKRISDINQHNSVEIFRKITGNNPKLDLVNVDMHTILVRFCQTGLGSSVGRVSVPRLGGTGFDPGPRHTKVVNNGTRCSPLSTRIFGVRLGLVAPVSV